MPTDFKNIIFDEIIENVATIINSEFNVPVYYNEHKGNQSFLITPESDNLVTRLSTGAQREYILSISFELKSGGEYTKNNLKQVSHTMERLKKLVYNNSSYSNGSEWFDANITSIEYLRDDDEPNILRGIATFNCQNTEVF